MKKEKKEVRINVRTTEDTKRDLKITARLRGLNESSLVNSLIVKAIREERSASPEEFATERNGSAESGPGNDPEGSRKWHDGLRNAKGLWKGRDDLPDLARLRREADRSDRWNEGK